MLNAVINSTCFEALGQSGMTRSVLINKDHILVLICMWNSLLESMGSGEKNQWQDMTLR